jgi:peptidoglycan/LPS O-acetylase OafA/YrhL
MKQEIRDIAQQSRAKSDSFREIQMLRGLSILFVLLYHTGIKQFDQLFIGVDIFLFISGFVLAEKLENIYLPIGKWKNKTLVVDFLIRRFCRIVPALSVTITTFSLLFFLELVFETTPEFSKRVFCQFLV